MMAAAAIVEKSPKTEVKLVEKNAVLGRKVTISGGGRCNVTTGVLDVREVLKKYPRGEKFLKHAMFSFPPAQVSEWFEKHGVKLKTEDDLRVFPRSDKGEDIVAAFEKLFTKSGVKVLLKHSVVKVEQHREVGASNLADKSQDSASSKFILHFKDRPPESFDFLIITTGGQAYRHTGSTGEGYNFAEALGHTITPLAPSLNSFICSEQWPGELAGVALKKATIKSRGEKKLEFTGPMLFTHKGITGPAVFALSSLVAFEKYDKTHPLPLFVDLIPDMSHSELEAAIIRELTASPKRDFSNTLPTFVARSIATVLCNLLEIDARKNNAEVSKKEILRLVEYLKNLPLHAVDRGAGDEFVTAGGVDLSEVDEKTMQSKICPGLYFAGEVLDIDGFTGGFNLQASWATGKLAGENAITQSKELLIDC